MKKVLSLILTIILVLTLFSPAILKADTDCEIEFGDSVGGSEVFQLKDEEGNLGEKLETGVVAKNDKITITASPNEGYHFVCWTYVSGKKEMYLSNKETVTFTVKSSYRLTAIYASLGEYGVVFVDSGKTIMKIDIVLEGKDASAPEIPFKKGYSKRGWTKDINNIKENLLVEPNYKATAWSVFRDYAGWFFKGLGLTLAFSVVSVFFALFLGAVICLARISKFKIVSFISGAYIEIIRGVPLLLQLLLVYAVMPRVDYGKFLNSEVIAAILTLFLNSAAYVAEIFRSGIQAVDKGQMEAGRALGMSNWTTMRKIILPQAIKNVLPSIGNELIMVIKETSLASTVDAGIGELMSVKKQITAASFINIPPFIVIAVMYFAVTFSLSKVVRLIERRLEARD